MTAPASTRTPLVLLDHVSHPVLVFNLRAEVSYSNAAARVYPGDPEKTLVGHRLLLDWLRMAALGKLILPMGVELPTARTTFYGLLQAVPGSHDAALLLRPPANVAHNASPGLATLVRWLNQDLEKPLQTLLQMLPAFAAASSSAEVAQATQDLQQKLQGLSDLSLAFGDQLLQQDERILLPDLLTECCTAVADEAERQNIRVAWDQGRTELPPVYGHRALLRRALIGCLELALRRAREELRGHARLTIEIDLKPSGQHLLLVLRNRGQQNLPASTAARSEAQSSAEADDFKPLSLPLARRVVELHGGHLLDEPGQGEIRLQLPTGAPIRAAGQALDLAQAQRYATDLAKLLARRRKET